MAYQSMPNQRLASTMQYATFSAKFCHSIAENQLYSTATLRNGNFFGCCVHWSVHRAAVQCRDSIIIRSVIHILQPNDVEPMTLSAPIHSQRDPSSRLGSGTAKVGCSITQVASSSIKSLISRLLHAHYCANRARIRLSSPFLQFLSHKLLFGNI
jgi:hypothetical protein